MLKAIETVYNGYRFRSRLEARWAVFFDTLGIRYEYEKEGYDLDGVWYLPDFWLPELKRWIEIKGQEPTEEEIKKVDLLCEGTDYPVILFHGLPGENGGYAHFFDCHDSTAGWRYDNNVRWYQCPCGVIDVDIRCEYRECHIIHTETWERLDGCDCDCVQYLQDYYEASDLAKAYLAARQARFEHQG
jgi:hypothetical protein